MFGRRKSPSDAAQVAGPARTVTLERDGLGAPAVNLTKIREAGHVDLAKRADKAGMALSQVGLSGIRAEAAVLLDHSGSMHRAYASGQVQTLVERALGFALQVDRDGRVPVVAFDSRVWPHVDVTVDNYQGVVDRDIWRRAEMGRTDLAAGLRYVRDTLQVGDAPLYLLVVTDGSPDSRREATAEIVELARYPVFVKILATTDDAWSYLSGLDDMDSSRRLVDNVDAKLMRDPAGLSDLEFANAMVDEWNTWVSAATAAGILRA